MLDLTFGTLNPDTPRLFTDVFGYFSAIIPQDFLNQPICKVVAKSIEDADLIGDGTFISQDDKRLYTSFLSGGTKQVLTALYARSETVLPPYLGCYFGDNCWDWVWLFSHLEEYQTNPLRIFMDSDIVNYDDSVRVYAQTPKGVLVSPAQIRDMYIGEVLCNGTPYKFSQQSCEEGVDNPRNPLHFEPFKDLCKEPDQVISMDDLNRIARQVLDSLASSDKTDLFN